MDIPEFPIELPCLVLLQQAMATKKTIENVAIVVHGAVAELEVVEMAEIPIQEVVVVAVAIVVETINGTNLHRSQIPPKPRFHSQPLALPPLPPPPPLPPLQIHVTIQPINPPNKQ